MTLRMLHVWHRPDKKLEAFVKRSMKLSISMFDGLPGRALATQEPAWISDISECPHFLRRGASRDAGLRSAVAFPIKLDHRTLGVMAFLTNAVTKPDEHLLQMFTILGSQIGQFMERKLAEEALRTSEERLRMVLQATRLGTFEVNVLTGEARWNDVEFELLGLKPGDVAPNAESFFRYVHPEDIDQLKRMWKAVGRTGRLDAEFRIIRPDGEIRWLASSGRFAFQNPNDKSSPKRNSQTSWFLGVNFDITSRKQAEESLRLSEKRLSYALDATSDGLWDWNIKTGEVYFSSQWIRQLGYSADDVIHSVEFWKSIVHPEDLPRVHEALQAHFDGLSPLYECENRLRMKSGQYRWNIDRGKVVERAADGSPLRMVGTDSDFSLRKRAQEVLKESEERERKRAAELAALLDAVPTPVLVAHDTGCLKIDGNRSADLLLRNTRGENVSIARANRRQPLHFRVLKDGLELPDDELPIQKAARGIPVENFEFSVLFEDGVRRDLLAYGTPLKDQDGRPKGAVLGMFDITERKRDEQYRQLHYEITRLLADLGSVEETIPVLLKTLAEAFGWQLGEFWEYSSTDRRLTLSHVWHARRKKLSDFAKQARLLAALMSKGLPGRVLATGNPEWVPNISQCPFFVQKRAAAQAGLRVAFAFPSTLGTEVVGALVFLGQHAVEPDELLIRMLKSMGSQIAQFIQRKKNEQALREAHEFGNQVMNGTQAGIVVCDQSSRVIAWNPFMEGLTGFASESVLGRFAQDVFLELRVQDFAKLVGRAMAGQVFEAADMLFDPLGGKEKAWATARFAPLPDAQHRIVGVIVAFRDITDRRRLENEVLEISDREQQRIGHDLHDGLGQQLTALEMKNFLIQQDLAVEDLEARKASLLQLAAEMGKALRDCITTTRSLARGLAPMTLKTEGLAGSLNELAGQTNVPGGIRCRFVCNIPDRIESSQTTGHLYRIAQEAVNNACKHSRARTIEISLSRTRGVLRLKIADDGRGLSPKAQTKSGMGLEVMRHRAHLIGASLDIKSQLGKGVSVICKLPLENDEH